MATGAPAGLPYAGWLASAAERAAQALVTHKRKIAIAAAAAVLLRMTARASKPKRGACRPSHAPAAARVPRADRAPASADKAAAAAAPRPKSAKKYVVMLMRLLSRARGSTRGALALAVLCVVKTAVSDYTGARACAPSLLHALEGRMCTPLTVWRQAGSTARCSRPCLRCKQTPSSRAWCGSPPWTCSTASSAPRSPWRRTAWVRRAWSMRAAGRGRCRPSAAGDSHN